MKVTANREPSVLGSHLGQHVMVLRRGRCVVADGLELRDQVLTILRREHLDLRSEVLERLIRLHTASKRNKAA